MGEAETLRPGILPQIQSLVSDNLQVVSFKWLSRNFSVSSNTAKRLLQEFVEGHGEGLEVVYALSGWLKDDPSVYHVKLVSKQNLAAREDFAGSCSVHVYSVQACVPKDSATIWNEEFLQAEGLFNQQSELRNCLRDNRFGGISNPFVKRDGDGDGVLPDTAFLAPNVNGIGGSSLADASKIRKAAEPVGKFQQTSSSKVQSDLSDVKDFKNGSSCSRASARATKMSEDKEKATSSLDHKSVVQDGNGSKQGVFLTSMWCRASVKRKTDVTMEEDRTASVNADAQICAHEAAELSSGDEGRDADLKMTSLGNGRRKRRVVFDDSDEEDEHLNAVNLGSPDVPKVDAFQASKDGSVTVKDEQSRLNLGEQDKVKSQVEEKVPDNVESKQALGKDVSCDRGMESGASSSGRCSGLSASDFNSKVDVPAPSSPTRRKVLRTRIDERGREVTEVVWEGKEVTTKMKSAAEDKPVGGGVAEAPSRAPPTRKSPAVVPVNPVGKAGSKKAGGKDPKQGNIMSFFKKV
ncbi:hypothetical protein MLD38_000594 [Melastoma candidum]|uniref:Uncharacterized protein n=1 Tax=Melastoma candidum TaxID=119954 RepID=A0ACB9SEJ2_9MYRT|nr:hypothetical protein MLD38_000594 [Melastoma candidum]